MQRQLNWKFEQTPARFEMLKDYDFIMKSNYSYNIHKNNCPQSNPSESKILQTTNNTPNMGLSFCLKKQHENYLKPTHHINATTFNLETTIVNKKNISYHI